MGNRGSKSVIFALYEIINRLTLQSHENITVKEQRVDGSRYVNKISNLRCTLVSFERNYK